MILINLLPHREAARKKRKEKFLLNVVLSGVLGLGISFLVYTEIQMQVDAQRQRNEILVNEIAVIEGEIKEVSTLQAEILALKARQNAVENLQSDRNVPVYLLEDLVLKLPEGVSLTSLKQEGRNLSIVGLAQTQARVSELLRSLMESQSISRPELIEIVSTVQNTVPRDQRKLFSFTIRGEVKRREPVSAAPATKKSGG